MSNTEISSLSMKNIKISILCRMSIINKSKSKTKQSKNNSLTFLYVRNVLAFLKNRNLFPRIFP